MIYKADLIGTDELLHLPETGMGYQVIEAKKPNSYFRERLVVYNSELIIEENSDFNKWIRILLNEGYNRTLGDARTIHLQEIRLLNKDKIKDVINLSESILKTKKRNSGVKGAIDNPEENANGEEIFVRLSAYLNDRRVDDINKKFIPGTFATTQSDYVICKTTSDDPIDRYALPNNNPIQWAFYVRPIKTDKLQRGIAQPAFGHTGGGEEVYFKNGTSNNTYFKRTVY